MCRSSAVTLPPPPSRNFRAIGVGFFVDRRTSKYDAVCTTSMLFIILSAAQTSFYNKTLLMCPMFQIC